MIAQWWVDPKELDEFQQTAIALPLDEDHLVTGPPGSGKTNLLVLRSTNLLRSGITNILMLVFNRTLEEFIANCPTPYSLTRDKLRTIQRWEMELINQLGGKPVVDGKFEENRIENCKILSGLVEEQKLQHLYDVILMDECQDYLEEEVKLLLRLAKNVFAAGDDRQQIYDHPSPISMLSHHCRTHNLPHHYRNGHKICELADEIGRRWGDYVPLLGASQYNETTLPSNVEVIKCQNIQEQAQLILAKVRHQIKAYPNDMIGVLCPRHKELSVVHDVFRGADIEPSVVFQNAEEGYLPFSMQTRVCLCTLHSAKGLEFRATHIAGVEWLKNFRELQIRMAYTGITRAKTILNLYHSDGLPQYLDGALAAVAPRPKPPGLDDLFKVK